MSLIAPSTPAPKNQPRPHWIRHNTILANPNRGLVTSPASDTREALLLGWRGFGGLDGGRGNAARAVPSGKAIDDGLGPLGQTGESRRVRGAPDLSVERTGPKVRHPVSPSRTVMKICRVTRLCLDAPPSARALPSCKLVLYCSTRHGGAPALVSLLTLSLIAATLMSGPRRRMP